MIQEHWCWDWCWGKATHWLLLWSNKTCTILGSRIGHGPGSDFRRMLDIRLIHGIVPMDIPENTLPNTLELNSLTYESI